jgi:hypothetical protein
MATGTPPSAIVHAVPEFIWGMSVHVEDVTYGSVFRKEGDGCLLAGRLVEAKSRLAVNSARWSEALMPHVGLMTGLRKILAFLASRSA